MPVLSPCLALWGSVLAARLVSSTAVLVFIFARSICTGIIFDNQIVLVFLPIDVGILGL